MSLTSSPDEPAELTVHELGRVIAVCFAYMAEHRDEWSPSSVVEFDLIIAKLQNSCAKVAGVRR